MDKLPQQVASDYSEQRREIVLNAHERFRIAQLAKQCAETCLNNNDNVLSDVNYFVNIPFHNNRRTVQELLIFKDSRFSHLDIRLPKKDPNTKIRIEAFDALLQGRVVRLEEIQSGHPLLSGGYFVDDSHAGITSLQNRSPDPLINAAEVADWLMNQAGLPFAERKRHLKHETDAVSYAANALSVRAKDHLSIRQAGIALRSNLEFYTEVIETMDLNNPLSPPSKRIYRTWINQHHDIDDQLVSEQVLVQFSPDDVLLAHDESSVTTVSVNIESSNPRIDAAQYATQQALEYEDGGIEYLFATVLDLVSDKDGKQAA